MLLIGKTCLLRPNIILVTESESRSQVNKRHLYNICTTSAQRLRRWSNIVQMLYKCFVFTGEADAQRLALSRYANGVHVSAIWENTASKVSL